MHKHFFLTFPILLGVSLLLLWMVPVQARPASHKSETGPLHPLEQRDGFTSEGGNGLVLKKTVGLDPGVCASSETISVTVGTKVVYCFIISNNTVFTLTDHTVEDSELGLLVNHLTYPLVPGASAYFTQSAIISTTTVNTATWTALNPINDYSIITGACNPFPDISMNGTALNLADDGEVNLKMPFRFQFYDLYTDRIRVGNNGGSVLGDTLVQIPAANAALPTDLLPRLITPFWDDLVSDTGNVYAGIYTTTLAMPGIALPGETPVSSSYFVVQWDEVSHFPAPSPSLATFAMLMLEPGQGNDGYIVFCYENTFFGNALFDNGASATIGLNKSGTEAHQFSYNTAHPELNGGFAIGFLASGSGEAAAATASATVYVPPLTFYKTVGTDPSLCADTNTLTVAEGTEVYYCYKVRNTSPHTLTLHTLEDSELGVLLEQFPYTLAPQASVSITQSAMITSTTINTATWTAEIPSSYTLIPGVCNPFPDISATGVPLTFDSNGQTELELPFAFPFYHHPAQNLTISEKGLIFLNAPASLPLSPNGTLPTDDLRNAIAPFWDDLTNETGTVYAGWFTYTLQTPGNNLPSQPGDTLQGNFVYYVFQWDQRSHELGAAGDTATFSVGLSKPGQGLDGYMFFCYKDTTFGNPSLDYGASATIGVNLNELTATLFSFDTSHPELNGNSGLVILPMSNSLVYTTTETATVHTLNKIFLPLLTKGSQ
ncbi:MAG: hypothetical protein H6636_04125 [Anaerolineales bacterium]|nr:hypothetical protein [Anaerolineales bacterium]